MIEKDDFEILDLRYKKIEDCDREMRDAAQQHFQLDKRLTVIEQGQKINNWLTAAIAGGIIALVIKVFVGG